MKMDETEIYFEQIQEEKQYKTFIKNVVKKCFQEEHLENLNFYMSITLTTPEQIRRYNREFRNIDKETDVLSFPMFEKEELEEIIKQQKKNMIPEVLGDCIISIQRVKEQAIEYGHSFERELAYMVVHSFYHLMGYDHMQESDKAIMREKEEIVLNKLGQTREL